jgi:hypothetical protein
MSDLATGKEWQEAQARVLLEEFRRATGNTASSMDEAKKWFTGLPLVERDQVGRSMNDPAMVGWQVQMPMIRKPNSGTAIRRWGSP